MTKPKPTKLCPWDASVPKVETYLANNRTTGKDLKSACSFITCPICGVSKGVIAQPGDEDLVAAEKEAIKLWDTRKISP